jgi:hypothetical protein
LLAGAYNNKNCHNLTNGAFYGAAYENERRYYLELARANIMKKSPKTKKSQYLLGIRIGCAVLLDSLH